MKKYLAIVLLVGGIFFIFNQVRGANTDIVINEIGAYPTSTHEWIEIWNKGAEPVDLTGWKFWENGTNHGLSASTTDATVAPGEYAAICQDEAQFFLDNPAFAGSVFDSSWSSLSESGEEIGLKDNEGNFVERFTYISVPNHSLERANPFLSDYSAVNWQENANGNTLGFINSNYLASPASSTTSTPTTTPESDTSSTWSQLKINEFVSDPQSGNEWVELYNPSTSSLDLEGGFVCDSRNATSTCKHLYGTTAGPGWFVFDLGTDSYLNNDGDSVILKNPEGTEIDAIAYSGTASPAKGQSLARIYDGADTDTNGDWSLTTQITAGSANIIVAPIAAQTGSGGVGSQTAVPVVLPAPTATSSHSISSSSIVLNELYPYPDEDEEEFIEIKNTTSGTIGVAGWKIADKSRSYTLSGSIGPGEIKYYEKSATNIALNNNTAEEVRLVGPQGQILGLVSYEKARKGLSYSRDASSTWHWTEAITPGAENKMVMAAADTGKEDIGLLWRIKYPSLIRQGQDILFDASHSLDPRGGRILFAWDFGEGRILFGDKPVYNFSSSGQHELLVRATSTAGTVDAKKIKIKVYPAGETVGAGVVVAEIAPNEINGEEYVRLKNVGTEPANLSNWKLIYNDRAFNIPTNTMLSAQDILTFYKSITNFALSNSGGLIELRDAEDMLVNAVTFGKTGAGDKYVLAGNEWVFVPAADKTAAKAKTAAKNPAKKTTPLLSLSIAQAREEDKDASVKVRGVVAVRPGIFGSQYFYITDGTAGIQVYQYKKDFPDLAVGDLVEVKGVLSVAGGVKRIKVKSRQDIDILATNSNTAAVVLDIGDLTEDYAGLLVKTAGEITEIKTNYMYIDDGTDEVMVYFKRGAQIDKSKFKEGETAEIFGVAEQAKNGLQIWPRSQDDVRVTGKSEDLIKKEAAGGSQPGDTAEKYLTATAGGITTLLLGFLARARGAMVVGFLRKTKGALAGIFRQNKG